MYLRRRFSLLYKDSMEKIDKFLAKLSRKERDRIEPIIEGIIRGDTFGLDVRKLRGRTDEYRVRVGPIRIQYIKTSVRNIITSVEFRGNNTY